MADNDNQGDMGAEALGSAPLGRRAVMGRMAALSVVPAVAGSGIFGFAASAAAATDAGLNARHLRYAVRGGKIIDGYFAAPQGKANLGVVVVLHGEAGFDAKAEETARRYANAGYYAIAPDLRATFKGSNHGAMVAEMIETAPGLKRLARGNGKVSLVSA
ncbi:MAG: dienelactone hydrolase family protein [Pseudomonadota bacterium]